MYQPPHHREDRRDILLALIRSHPLATLVTTGPDGLDANHIPMLLDEGRGRLLAHVARANDLSKGRAGPVLAIFQGPDAYITPSWYESKREHGKTVPTWNYAVVHVHGPMHVIEDRDWLRRHVGQLTDRHEAGRAQQWQVSDAPPPYIEAQLKGIVGLEIEIARIEGKWKVSQNRPAADRRGVVEGLLAEDGRPDMAGLVDRFGPPG
jgi:transcriptional regulator